MQACNIVNNGEYAFYASACNDPTTVIDATNNWWGIADSASIEAIVYHQADDPGCPAVYYVPFTDGPFACCKDIRGNVNGDVTDQINVADLTYLVDYLFRDGPSTPCSDEADVNGDGSINVVDVTSLVHYLFRSGSLPALCP